MSNVRAEFFRGPHGRDMVRIAIIGDPSVYEGRAEAAHIARFPREHAAYTSGRPVEAPAGLPLEAVPGMAAGMAGGLRARGVRNAQELAALSDHAVKGLGMGAATAREAARAHLAARRAQALDAAPVENAAPAVAATLDPSPPTTLDPHTPSHPHHARHANHPHRASRPRGRP